MKINLFTSHKHYNCSEYLFIYLEFELIDLLISIHFPKRTQNEKYALMCLSMSLIISIHFKLLYAQLQIVDVCFMKNKI